MHCERRGETESSEMGTILGRATRETKEPTNEKGEEKRDEAYDTGDIGNRSELCSHEFGPALAW